MDAAKWKIFISSTDNDLHDIRSCVYKYLKCLEFEVLAFEKVDFNADVAGKHSHDACLEAVAAADIYILILDKRYGSPYYANRKISITEAEYNKAKSLGKIIFTFARKQLFDERISCEQAVSSLLSSSKISRLSAKKTIRTKWAENWKLLDFVNKIDKSSTGNWINTYDNYEDIEPKLHCYLRSLTPRICNSIVKEQLKFVKAIKTTTGMDLSLGDVIDRNYWIEPPYTVKSGNISPGGDCSTVVLEALRNANNRILVNADPGAGKSSLLAKVFITHSEKMLAQSIDPKDMPFWLNLADRGSDYSFDLECYFRECFAIYLNRELFPCFDISLLAPIFYIDGMDEMTDDISDIVPAKIANSTIFARNLFLSCRKRFAEEIFIGNTLGSKFNHVIFLPKWSKFHINHYVKQFCINRRILNKEKKILKLFSETGNEVITSPIILSMFLAIIEYGNIDDPVAPKDVEDIFHQSIYLLALREIDKHRKSGLTTKRTKGKVEALISLWGFAAWIIYKSRFDSRNVELINVIDEILASVAPNKSTLLNSRFFSFIFNLQSTLSQSPIVKGMIHEQLLEFLVAHAVCSGVENNVWPFPELLSYIIRPEINRIIKVIIGKSGNQSKQNIINHLFDKYSCSLTGNASSLAEVIKRNQATYFLGRIGTLDAIDKLKMCAEHETSIIVKLSIAFGLVKSGDWESETKLFQALKDVDWDAHNRGYHLVYYKDMKFNGDFNDPGDIPWDRAFIALYRHLYSNEIRHYALRRIELYTIRRFIETRNSIGAMANFIDDMRRNVNIILGVDTNAPFLFKKNVKLEWNCLLNVVKRKTIRALR